MGLVREGLRLQFVSELPEFVEIDARPESKGMWDGLRRTAPSSRRNIAQPGADCAIDGFFKGDAEFLGALLQEARQVVIEGEGGPHAARTWRDRRTDVKTSKTKASIRGAEIFAMVALVVTGRAISALRALVQASAFGRTTAGSEPPSVAMQACPPPILMFLICAATSPGAWPSSARPLPLRRRHAH